MGRHIIYGPDHKGPVECPQCGSKMRSGETVHCKRCGFYQQHTGFDSVVLKGG